MRFTSPWLQSSLLPTLNLPSLHNNVPSFPPLAALIVRYVTRRFIYDYAPEIAKVYTHTTQLDQEDVHMEIWDTTGHFQVRRTALVVHIIAQ